MSNALGRLFAFLSALAIAYFFISIMASVSQIADAADRIALGSGAPVFWTLLVSMAGLLITPAVLFYRLPKPLVPPEEATGPAYDSYVVQLKRQLRANPRLAGMPLESDADLAAAIARLSEEANRVVRDTASAVFVSTAVMQNGRLDALIVLGTQVRMTWQIASIYYQRPSPRQALYLYGNVGANVLVASSIHDVDFSAIVTPIVSAAFPSLKGAFPGMQGISQLLVNSMASGAANAFLTLRIGILARSYCEALTAPNRPQVRKRASLAALELVGGIAQEQGSRVVRGAWDGVRGAVESATSATFRETKEVIGKVAATTVDGVKSAGEAAGRVFGRKSPGPPES